ncbi:MAG: SH3 domain-containing protein [Elusimicrobia bacterium]|nr:SH3 domain-containing protein [Elusimicrobiota bacterium]
MRKGIVMSVVLVTGLAYAGDVTVWLNSVRVRKNPSPESPVITTVHPGDPLKLTGTSKGEFKTTLRGRQFVGPWVEVMTWEGNKGWIFGPAISIEEELDFDLLFQSFSKTYPNYTFQVPEEVWRFSDSNRPDSLDFSVYGEVRTGSMSGAKMILGHLATGGDGDDLGWNSSYNYLWKGGDLVFLSSSSDEIYHTFFNDLETKSGAKISTDNVHRLPWASKPPSNLTVNGMSAKFSYVGYNKDREALNFWQESRRIDTEDPIRMRLGQLLVLRPGGEMWVYWREIPNLVLEKGSRRTYQKTQYSFRDGFVRTGEARNQIKESSRLFTVNNSTRTVVGTWFEPEEPSGALVMGFFEREFQNRVQGARSACQSEGRLVRHDYLPCGEDEKTHLQRLTKLSFKEFSESDPILILRDALGEWSLYLNQSLDPDKYARDIAD